MDVLTLAVLIFLFNIAALAVVALGLKPSRQASEIAFGYVAGVMIAVSFISLLGKALGGFPSTLPVFLGVAAGVAVLWLADKLLPHEHPSGAIEGPAFSRLRRVWLAAIAMGIHNVPEGLAVGVSLAFSEKLGLSTALAIGLHDFVETSVLAASLALAGLSATSVAVVVAVSSLIEAVSVAPGYALPSHIPGSLPLFLSLAAGAMIYVVIDELIPEVMRETSEHRGVAFLGFIAGVYTVLALEAVLVGF